MTRFSKHFHIQMVDEIVGYDALWRVFSKLFHIQKFRYKYDICQVLVNSRSVNCEQATTCSCFTQLVVSTKLSCYSGRNLFFWISEVSVRSNKFIWYRFASSKMTCVQTSNARVFTDMDTVRKFQMSTSGRSVPVGSLHPDHQYPHRQCGTCYYAVCS